MTADHTRHRLLALVARRASTPSLGREGAARVVGLADERWQTAEALCRWPWPWPGLSAGLG
jgi:hypothetical protein